MQSARRPRMRPSLLLVATFLVMSVGGLATSWAFGDRPGRIVGGNLPVNPGAADHLVVTAENSPTVVADPRDPAHLAIAERIDLPTFACNVEISFDGGATWIMSTLTLPTEKTVACFMPDIAFDADGRLHLAYSSYAQVPSQGTAPDAVWLATSKDGGRTFEAPIMVSGPLAFQIRLLADPSRVGRLYLAWMQARETSQFGVVEGDNPIVATRSDDAGTTWTHPTRISPVGRTRVVAPSIAANHDGQVFIAYLDVGNDRLDYTGAHEERGGPPYDGRWALVVARSGDAGATWREVVADQNIVPTERFVQLFPTTPALTVDRHGVYVAFTDGRSGDPDVWLWHSGDGGRTFGAGRRVNDTAPGDGRSQYLPAVATSNGRIDVLYYDRRADPRDVMNEVSIQSSFDDGRSFTPHVTLTDRPFDSRVGLNRERGLPNLGSRLAVVATDRASLTVWSDTRAGSDLIAKQLLARAVIAAPHRSRLRPARWWVGVTTGVLALVLLGATALLGQGSHNPKVAGSNPATATTK